MSPPLLVVETAERFWSESGISTDAPRDIRRAVARAHPIAIVMLSTLHVARVEAWLRQTGLEIEVGVDGRPLHACLVAQHGTAFIFVDGNDGEREQRYSIAHELGHFLHDYLAPRKEAVARHGDAILEVLEGLRPPRVEERAIALLAHAAVGRHVHLMERRDGNGRQHIVERAEATADALALELLAPWSLLTDQIAELRIGEDRIAIASLLMEQYGLPSAPAWHYAGQVDSSPRLVSPLLRHVRDVGLAKTARNR